MDNIISTMKDNFSCAQLHAAVQAVAWILQITGAEMDLTAAGAAHGLTGFVFLVTFTEG